MSDEAWRFTWV